jgi:hypothetical protein
MLQPPKDAPLWRKLGDAITLMLLTLIVLGLAWMCSQAGDTLQPEERDCLDDLRASTRQDTNYTEHEVVTYGRCLLFQKGQ